MTERQYNEYLARRNAQKGAGTALPALRAVKVTKWTETEKRYFYGVLRGVGAYEGAELRITPDECERHIYTPDFVTEIVEHADLGGDVISGRRVEVYHEVKGSYRLGSQDAARLRWCFAAIANPKDIFVWAKETREHRWDIEVWYCGGRVRLHGRNVKGFDFDAKGGVAWVR